MRKAKGRKYWNKNIPKTEQCKSKTPKNENYTPIIKTNQYKLSQYTKNYYKKPAKESQAKGIERKSMSEEI